MADPVSAALVIATVASTAVSAQQSYAAEKDADTAGRRQKRDREAAMRELAQRQAEEDARESGAGATAAARARAAAASASGIGGSVKTTALGLPGNAGGQSTALGL